MQNRIKQVRKELRMTQAEFGEALGVGRMAVTYWESGTRQPSSVVIKALCNNYNVNYDWLVNGDGDMFQDDSVEGKKLVDQIMEGDNEFAKNVLIAFAKMDESYWQTLHDVLKSYFENENKIF